MTLRSPEAVGEVFDSGLGIKRELSKDERRHVGEIARQIIGDYHQAYAEFATENWNVTAERLVERSSKYAQQIDANVSGKEAQLLHALNKTFGELPKECIGSQLGLKQPGVSREKKHELSLRSAGWQISAMRSLYELSKVRTGPGEQQYMLDTFFSTVKMAYGNIPNLTTEDREELQYKMISGIYGPVAVATILEQEGYDTWLSQADDDVSKKADLIYGQARYGSLPEHLFLAQVKSGRAAENEFEEGKFWTDPPLSQMSTKDTTDWEILTRFSGDMNRTPHFADQGVDFTPIWVNITHAGLRDADDWRNGLKSIEKSD